MKRKYFQPPTPALIGKQDTVVVADLALLLVPRGYRRRYEVRDPDTGKTYRITFAHPRRRIAILLGHRDERKDAVLRRIGWRVYRP